MILIGEKILGNKNKMHLCIIQPVLYINFPMNKRIAVNKLFLSFKSSSKKYFFISIVHRHIFSLIKDKLVGLIPQYFNSTFSLLFIEIFAGKHLPYAMPEMHRIRPGPMMGALFPSTS